jgi:hypothetical protein
MAKATKKKPAAVKVPKRLKQGYLPKMAPPRLPKIDKAAEKFTYIRGQKFALIKQFADAKINLISEMREAGLTHYEYDGQVVDLDESASVTVKPKDQVSDDED